MSAKPVSSREKKMYVLLGTSVLIIIFGLLFLVNAMGVTDFYPHYAAIGNALGKYIIVILTMSAGIMLFSNAALRLENDKQRKGLTIGITAFAFILTLPLVYVFVSMIPFAATHDYATVKAAVDSANASYPTLAQASEASAIELGLNPVDKTMGIHTIFCGFAAWFGTGGFLWVVLVFMLILSVIFLIEPLAAGVLVCKGKMLMLFSKDENGKFHVFYAKELPALKARREAEIYLKAA